MKTNVRTIIFCTLLLLLAGLWLNWPQESVVAEAPHADDHAMMSSASSLVGSATATHIAIASGNWTDSATWQNGTLPTHPYISGGQLTASKILSTTTVTPSASSNRTLYVFGDSWASDMTTGFGSFDQELQERGYNSLVTVNGWGESGSTAAQWSQSDTFANLLTAITNDANPNPIVFFTLGGNDVLASEPGQLSTTYDQIQQHIGTIVTDLLATRNDIEIVIGGYDLFNPSVNAICPAIMTSVFGSEDPFDANSAVHEIHLRQAIIAAQYSNVTAVNTSGSLQGTPGHPDLNEWSPVEYLADCIHLNAAGYSIYLDIVFNDALSPIICADADAACEASTHTIYLPIVIGEAIEPTTMIVGGASFTGIGIMSLFKLKRDSGR